MVGIEFGFVGVAEDKLVRDLLKECGLPHEDISEHLSHFIAAKRDDELVGVVGLEVHGKAGLLRSLAVVDAFRGEGTAKALCTRILAHAHQQGIEEVCLLTMTAEGFFAKLGFDKVDRNSLPESIQGTEEFRSLCPVTAVCMTRKIGGEARYYPKDSLVLQPDVPGARQWGVTLDRTMLTYFECDADCRFKMHSHESEQITMVLDGVLFFEVDGRVVGVGKGEVIAIPSNVPHAVFTREHPVKAVDAWSPVMEKYKS